MSTLAELRAKMNGPDPVVAAAAEDELANIETTFRRGKGALADTLAKLEIELDETANARDGVDQARVSKLLNGIDEIEASMANLDRRMRAFRHSGSAIKPPTPADVNKVKTLTTELAQLQTKDNALGKIIAAATDVGNIGKTA